MLPNCRSSCTICSTKKKHFTIFVNLQNGSIHHTAGVAVKTIPFTTREYLPRNWGIDHSWIHQNSIHHDMQQPLGPTRFGRLFSKGYSIQVIKKVKLLVGGLLDRVNESSKMSQFCSILRNQWVVPGNKGLGVHSHRTTATYLVLSNWEKKANYFSLYPQPGKIPLVGRFGKSLVEKCGLTDCPFIDTTTTLPGYGFCWDVQLKEGFEERITRTYVPLVKIIEVRHLRGINGRVVPLERFKLTKI